MNWNHLTELSQIDKIVLESKQNRVLIFKHSKSCSISSTSLNRLERNWNLGEKVKPYLLDLLSYREISNEIERKFDVHHESPQVIIIENGRSIYDSSHFDINFNDIRNRLQMVEDQ